MANKKYTPPQYPSKNKDAINNAIMKKMNDTKAAGANVPTVSIFNLDNVPSVVPDIKNVGKKNR